MDSAEKLAKDIATKLTQVQKRMAEDRSFQKRVQENPSILAEMNFTPEQISTFRLEKITRDSCYCDCIGWKGLGRGCFVTNDYGAVTDP